MPINLRKIISSIESSNRSVNSSTSLREIKRLTHKASRIDKTIAVYDSTGALPIDSAFAGALFSTSDGKFYSLDSANGSWQLKISGVVAAPEPWTYQGRTYSYTSGGAGSGNAGANASAPYRNTISKFSYATETDDTNVGTLTRGIMAAAGLSEETYSYNGGGSNPSDNFTIDKVAYASDGPASFAASLGSSDVGNAGMNDITYGYIAGGTTGAENKIVKLTFSSDTVSGSIYALTRTIRLHADASSETHGYTLGGRTPGGLSNVIDKFPFASAGHATDVGDLTITTYENTGHSSTTYGYNTGGITPALSSVIQKTPFASDANATNVANLSYGTRVGSGTSSQTSGYNTTSYVGGPGNTNNIQKFTFATDTNVGGVGALATARSGGTGTQT